MGTRLFTSIGPLALASLAMLGACTESGSDDAPFSAIQTGGFSATGGFASGGLAASGGIPGSGGFVNSGGLASGGLMASGGMQRSGGTMVETGGMQQSGGTMVETGGMQQTGGLMASGGMQESGGTMIETGGMDWGMGETGPNVGATAAHNAVRARVMADTPLPPLMWDPDLASYAQEWADNIAATTCVFQHRSRGWSDPGENGYQIWGTTTNIEQVVEGWAAEIDCWTYGRFMETDSCSQSCVDALHASGCGHYTQVVWRDAQRVGCGSATCGNSQIWVCNYDTGNIVKQFPY